MKWLPILATVFIVLPIVELSILLMVAQAAGHWWVSLLIVIFTGMLGAYLAKWQGRSVWVSFLQTARQGRLPADEFVDGAIIFFSAGLLLTPGIITDCAGLFMLSPWGKVWMRQRIKTWIKKRFDIKVDTNPFAQTSSPVSPFPRDNVVEGEARKVDE